MAQDIFTSCFAIVVGTEGGFTDDPQDPGNWTGGKIGLGELHGTKFGISAAAYPDIDIRNLTIEQAQAIYFRDYWQKLKVKLTYAPLAVIMFDAGINHGVEGSIKWMQKGIGVRDDGEVGDITEAALKRGLDADPTRVCADILAVRIHEMPTFSAWEHDGLGWSRRCAMLPFQAAQLQKDLSQ